MNFPIYRKYKHNRTFFKVIDKENFEEIQLLGSSFSVHRFKAGILPDRNYIADLISNEHNNWIVISETEYEAKLNYCRNNLKEISL